MHFGRLIDILPVWTLIESKLSGPVSFWKRLLSFLWVFKNISFRNLRFYDIVTLCQESVRVRFFSWADYWCGTKSMYFFHTASKYYSDGQIILSRRGTRLIFFIITVLKIQLFTNDTIENKNKLLFRVKQC